MRIVKLLGRKGVDSPGNEYYINIDHILLLRKNGRTGEFGVVMAGGYEILIDMEAYNELVNTIKDERKNKDKA